MFKLLTPKFGKVIKLNNYHFLYFYFSDLGSTVNYYGLNERFLDLKILIAVNIYPLDHFLHRENMLSNKQLTTYVCIYLQKSSQICKFHTNRGIMAKLFLFFCIALFAVILVAAQDSKKPELCSPIHGHVSPVTFNTNKINY